MRPDQDSEEGVNGEVSERSNDAGGGQRQRPGPHDLAGHPPQRTAERRRVAPTPRIAVAASWNPLVKSNARASATTAITRTSARSTQPGSAGRLGEIRVP